MLTAPLLDHRKRSTARSPRGVTSRITWTSQPRREFGERLAGLAQRARQDGGLRLVAAKPHVRSGLRPRLSIAAACRTARRRERRSRCRLLAIGARMARHVVRVGGLAVAPSSMTVKWFCRLVGPPPRTQVAFVLAAVIGELLGDCRPVLPLRRMTSTWVTPQRPLLRTWPEGATETGNAPARQWGLFHRLDLVPELGRRGAPCHGYRRSLVLPRLEEHELVR